MAGAPIADPSLVDAADVTAAYEVDAAVGLSAEEAVRRLDRDGPNELRGSPRVPTWRRILGQFRDPLIYLLLGAIVVSLIGWFVEGAEGWPIDAVVIAAIVLLNGLLGWVQEGRADDAVAALSTMTAASSTVLRDGRLATVLSSELVRGDVLVLGEGDQVGADARLLEANALRIAEASLTGESHPVAKNADTIARHASIADRSCMAFKGTAVSQGVGRAIVTGVGMNTEVGRIATMLDATQEEPTPLQEEIGRVGRALSLAVIAIALVVMVTTVLVQGVTTPAGLVTVFLLGVSLAVAAVPEGLPAILSVVLSIGVQRMAKRNAVVKQLKSVETLGSASVICADKTGTLTRNEMMIQRIITASGRVQVTGAGYQPDGALLDEGAPITDAGALFEVRQLLGAGGLANNAQLTGSDGEWTIQGDPTEAAFLVAAGKLAEMDAVVAPYERVDEIPFTSERKMMSTVNRDVRDGTLVLFSKGAPDVLLDRCDRMQRGESVLPMDAGMRQRALADIEALSGQALRTLGVAYRPIGANGGEAAVPGDADGLERDLIYVGVVGILDPPREEAKAAIREAHRAGVRIVMITGDHPATAARIAADLGIAGSGEPAAALAGDDLDILDNIELQDAVRTTSVFARVSPRHKLRIVDALQANGGIVAMTGDGVNDAPALKSADIGIAMGITGTEVTKDAARMILADDNFATIIVAVRQGRVILDNIKKSLRYLLSSNMGEVFTVFFGVLLAGTLGLASAGDGGVVLPLLVTQILWINLVTDSGPALAMGIDPEIDDVMAREPRGVNDRAIPAAMWAGILSTGLVMAVVTLTTIDLFLPGGLIEGEDTLAVARTAGFTTLVFAQMFNTLNARSASSSAFRRLFVNRWLWGALGLTVVLQVAVVEIPLLQTAFGTASMDAEHWLACVALSSIVLWFEELRKLGIRLRARHVARAGRGLTADG
ncbi:cation-translocating P-type ATPase [Marisediminicola antarctica]